MAHTGADILFIALDAMMAHVDLTALVVDAPVDRVGTLSRASTVGTVRGLTR
jgi:hypothetical protein